MKTYYSVYTRNNSKQYYGFINAQSLQWDNKQWKFSTGKTTKIDAINFVKQVFKIAQTNPKNFDLKRTLQILKTGESVDQVYTLQDLINDRLDHKQIKDCEICKQAKKPENLVMVKNEKSLDSVFDNNGKFFEDQDTIKTPVKKTCDGCQYEKGHKSYMTIGYQLKHFTRFDTTSPAQDLSLDYVKGYIENMRSKKFSDATIHSSLDFFKAGVNQAIKKGKITRSNNIDEFLTFRNELKKTQYQTNPNQRPDTFTDTKLDRVISNCKSDEMILMLNISSKYPTRFSELRKLRLDDFEIRNGKGYLKFDNPLKHGQKREIGIDKDITNKLQAEKEIKTAKSDYFFSDENGELIKETVLRNHFNYARKQANVDCCFHQLRQRATTNCFRAGLDLKVIQVLGGWRTEKMCLRYYKPKDSDFEKVGDTIDDYLKRKNGL